MAKELFLSSDAIKHRICNQFSENDPQIHEGLDPFVTFNPVHDSWQPIELCDDGFEITIYYGQFTHVHFGNYDEELTVEEAELAIVDSVIDHLAGVFRDELEFYSDKRSGGCRPRGTPDSSLGNLFSKKPGMFGPGRSYPIDGPNLQLRHLCD